MKEFQIGKNEAGQRLDKYLHKRLPGAPNSFLYKMLRKKNIVLNQKKAAGGERISTGDAVTFYLSDETFEKFSGAGTAPSAAMARTSPVPANVPGCLINKAKKMLKPDIIYEDAHILAMNKPAGMLSQKARPADISANEILIQYLLDTGALTPEEMDTFCPSVCNRLDRNTSGILIAGKTLQGLQMMAEQFKEHSIDKYYRCIVQGNLEEPGHLKGWLSKDIKKNQVRVYPEEQPGGWYIETAYRPVQQYGGYTQLEVRLLTGRTHQIRAHLAYIGHPLIGDTKYGNARTNQLFRERVGLNHQLLHAYRMVLKDKTRITAPLPPLFQTVERLLDTDWR